MSGETTPSGGSRGASKRLSRRTVAVGLVGLAASVSGLSVLGGRAILSNQAHIPRVEFVYSTPLDARAATRVAAFRAGRRDYGYAEGQKLSITR
jgi:hypothetical protein